MATSIAPSDALVHIGAVIGQAIYRHLYYEFGGLVRTITLAKELPAGDDDPEVARWFEERLNHWIGRRNVTSVNISIEQADGRRTVVCCVERTTPKPRPC